MCAIKCENDIMVVVQNADVVAEWLRRQIANLSDQIELKATFPSSIGVIIRGAWSDDLD